MPVVQGVTLQFKEDLLNGVHQPGDTYKIALYTQAAANLNKNTTAYTATGEVSGPNYVAGGVVLSGRTVSGSGDMKYLDFDDAVFASVTITADAAMIYNASKSNKTLANFTFASASATAGNFTVQMPNPASDPLIRIP